MDETTGTTVRLRTIVVGVDKSWERSERSSGQRREATETSAEVVAVHVLTYSHEFAADLSLASLTDWRRQLEGDLAGPWTDAARAVESRSRGSSSRTRPPPQEFSPPPKSARRSRCPGCARPGNLADRVLGATTYRATHRARTPVVIIPVDWKPHAGS